MTEREPSVAFYTVSDARFFLGTAALLNSLRAVGHDEPLLLLDCGLEPWQRALLEPHTALVPSLSGASAVLSKTVLPRARPAEVMVLVDSDVLVLRHLEPLFEQARGGRAVAFTDPLQDRFFPEWGELLDLGPLTPHPYVNAGMLVLPRRLGLELVEVVHAKRGVVDLARTGRAEVHDARPTPGYPFRFPDQDIWNAALAVPRRAGDLVALEQRLSPFPPFRGVRPVDGSALECRDGDGARPYVLHFTGRHKPWLAPTRATLYHRLMSCLLLAPDALVRVPPGRLPAALRAGVAGSLARRYGDLVELGRVPRGRLGVRRRLSELRSRRLAHER